MTPEREAEWKADMIEKASWLSQIDYALGPPNDMQCSLYDVDLDGNRVVAHVKAIIKELDSTKRAYLEMKTERDRLHTAIYNHHKQKADDRCFLDDVQLYAAAELPPHDPHVGSKEAMLENCKRFLELRCKEGKWKTYAELESALRRIATYDNEPGRIAKETLGIRDGCGSDASYG